MRHDELDRILSEENDLTPSSGFLESVMETVRSDASAPPPIPFPWKRAWPGVAACLIAVGVLLVACIALLHRQSVAASSTDTLPSSFVLCLQVAKATGAGWIALALIISHASIMLSNRLGSGK